MGDRSTRDEAIRVIETFNNLPVDQKMGIFRNLSPAAREELLGTVARPQEIMRLVSEEQVFFDVKELGEDQAPNIIALTTGRQLQYILDLDLWKKDMFDQESAGRWLEILSRVGRHKLLQFVQTTDPELLVTALQHLLRIKARNPDIDLLEEIDILPSFSLDDTFFIEFLVPRWEDSLRVFLETVFEWNTQYYFTLMNELAWGVQSENQEQANKWRRSRLADRGFPEFEEALDIYRYMQRSGISGHELEPAGLKEDQGSPEPYLGYPLKVVFQDNLFKRSIDVISDSSEKDRLSVELAHVANKVMVADARDPGSIEELRTSLKKVAGYINMALEDLCGEDTCQAADLLRSNHMEVLFRRGFSLILDLRRDAQKFIRDRDGGIENLGYPLAGFLDALIQKRPVFASHLLGNAQPRQFESLGDISQIRTMMENAATQETWEPI